MESVLGYIMFSVAFSRTKLKCSDGKKKKEIKKKKSFKETVKKKEKDIILKWVTHLNVAIVYAASDSSLWRF